MFSPKQKGKYSFTENVVCPEATRITLLGFQIGSARQYFAAF
jgi:hypothetical protein